MQLSLSQSVIGLLILLLAYRLGSAAGAAWPRLRRGGPSARRPRKRTALPRRGVAWVLLAAVTVTLTGDPARAVGELPTNPTPALSLPSGSTVLAWLGGEPAPGWKNLPRQEGDSPDGAPPPATSEDTRSGKGNGHTPKPGKGELPAYEPLEPKHEKGQSAKGVVGYVAKTSKRNSGKSTATSDYYDNADGSHTRVMSQAPVNFRDGKGEWKPIDPTLQTQADGDLAQTANGVGTEFAPSAADPELVRMSVDGYEVTYGLQGAAPVAPVVQDTRATYPDVLAQTDLELEATRTGLKETLVLKNADAASQWVFPLDSGGLTPELDANGGVLFKDAKGEVVTRVPAPYAEDSKWDPRSGHPAMTHDVEFQLFEQDGRTYLALTLDEEWLKSPDRAFPVRVDPTYTMYSVSTYVMTNWDGDHSAERTIAVGSWDNGPHTARSYLKFPDQVLDGSGVTVTAAKLKIFNIWASTCSAQQFDVFEGLEPWETWDAKMSTYATSPGFTQWLGYGYKAVPNACANNGGVNPDPAVGDLFEVSLDKNIINGWAQGTRENYGLVLNSPVDDNAHWKQFASYNNRDNPPRLEVTYTGTLPPQVRNQAPADGYVADTLTPALSATSTVDAAATVDGVRFRVYDSAGTQLADSGNVVTANSNESWTVPSGVLAWGKSYYWTAQAFDGVNYAPDFETLTLSTQVPQPEILSTLSQNGDEGYDPVNGNYTTTATDAEVETVGPELAVSRDYNSRDPRVTGAFGASWSSVFDAKVALQYVGSTTTVKSANVTYPDGSVVGFGKNSDGTFSPPSGRFATFRSTSATDYTLTDKMGTVYRFAQNLTGGVTGITSITDANGRALNFTWTGAVITKATSATSGRSLFLTWTTPTGTANQHVTTVKTDPATAGQAATAETWTYTYTGDRLSQACSQGCIQYTYESGSNYHSQVLDQGADSFWPLAETSGGVAYSAALENQGSDNALYTNVTLGAAGPLAGGQATAATFNGTNSGVQLPRTYKIGTKRPQGVSLWFKTTTAGRVLFSYQQENPLTTATAPSDYTPALYIDSNGKLNGTLFTNNTATQYSPMVSAAAVTDGNWHNAVLTGDGATQWLYLDGQYVDYRTGLHEVPGQWTDIVGAGYLGYKWPNQPNYSTSVKTGYASFFQGSIANVAYFDKLVSPANVGALWQASQTPTAFLKTITRPSGKAFAAVDYDLVTRNVTKVTDENGGVWELEKPTVSGSSKVYRGSVLGSAPATYFRLADGAGASQATDDLNSGTGTYGNVTLGGLGPFPDSPAAKFNGTTSYVELPANNSVGTRPGSVELWFSTSSAAGGVLYAQQENALPGATSAAGAAVPALYVGTDGKLHGKFWDANGTGSPLVSAGKVNDGKWHHALLSATANSQTLYLDGAAQGTVNAALVQTVANKVYVGGGFITSGWAAAPTNVYGYLNGSIAHVAYYRGALSADEATAHFTAASLSGGLAPVKSVRVKDPGGAYLTHEYDLANGGRQLAVTDGLGNRTAFGYDTGGFLRTTTDPNRNVDTTGHDARGNEISKTTCQNQAENKCSTTYYSYFPDATTTQLTPNPKNDVLLTVRDGRSTGPTDDTFLTVYAYDAAGNQTQIVTPPVPGFPGGRFTNTSYTDGTTIAAADSGYAPAGLPYRTVSPSGAVTLVSYFRSGDVASVTDAAGLVTRYTYDGLGRPLTKTTVSDTYPAGLTESYVYDAVGQVVQENDPAILNRVTGAIHTARTTTVFDVDGNVTSQTVADLTGGDASRATSATYNARGQMETSTDGLGKVTSFTYDAYGNTATETDASGAVTAYTYDANGKLLTQKLQAYTGDPGNPSAPHDLVQQANAYDPAGRLASVTDAMGYTTRYTYTNNDLVATVTKVDAAGQNPFVEQDNTYDAAGNAIKQVTNNGATTAQSTVDTASRVLSTTIDPTGVNRKTTYAYTPDDLVATSTQSDAGGYPTVTSFSYDPMGRVTKRSVMSDDPGHPVAWWKLDQTTGKTVHDDSGTGFTAAAGTGVTWADSAAALDGTANATIATNGPVVDTSQSFSVSAWVKPNTLTGAQTIASQDGARQSGFVLKYEPSVGKYAFLRANTDTDNPSVWSSAVSTTSAAVGTWAHLVATFNAADGSMKIFVNGQQQGTATAATPFNGTGQFVVGRAKWNGYLVDYANASIGNVQAYNRTLSGTEVTKLFTGGRGGATTAASTAVTTKYTLDKRGLPTRITDPNGNATDLVYDEAGQSVVATGPTVNVETAGGTPVAQHPVTMTGYNTFGEPTEAQDANGNVTTTTYDAEGQQKSVVMPPYTAPGASAPTPSSQNWTYDAVGQVTQIADGLGNTTSYTYDQLGNTASVEDADGNVATTVYDANSRPLAETSPTGARTQATYDHLGRTLTTTELERYPSPVAATTTYSYASSATNPGGAFLASATSPQGRTTTYGYNKVGEQTAETDPAGATTTTAYDKLGRPTKVTAHDGTAVSVGYDVNDNPISTKKLGTDGTTVLSTATAVYDAAGRSVSTTDERGFTTTFTRDAGGLLTSQTEPVTATTSIVTGFGYDANGNRTRTTDGRGNSWIYGYNSWNLQESTLEPTTPTYTAVADRRTLIRYDADQQATSQILPGGVTVSAQYDDLGRLTTQSGSGADAATATRTYTYDDDGRMLTAATASIGITVASTSETFTYNDRDMLLTAAGSAGSSSFAYGTDGLLASRTDAAGTTAYGYDTAGRLSTLDDPLTGTRLTYGYDTMSQLTSIAYGTAKTRSFTYDTRHRPTGDTLKTSAGTTIASVAYGYDDNSNVTSKTTTGVNGASANTYTYDRANRITGWNNGTTTTAYAYDASGNRVQVGAEVYTYDARDQLTSDGHTTYAYTARGTLSAQTGTSSGTYTSDAFGQQITQSAGAAGTQTYLLDALGRVITSGGPNPHTFAYSGMENTVASDGSNTYSRDTGDGLVGIGLTGSPSASVLAWTDRHDDVIGNFTTASTGLTGSTTYDPFGKKTASAGMAGNVGFQSGWTDASADRVNMTARWYNPATGQFQNKDTFDSTPTPNSANANPFAYVADNPVTGTDPSGHCWICGVAKKATSAVSTAYNYTTTAASTAWKNTTSYANSAWNYTVRTAKTVVHKVKDVKKKVTKVVKNYYQKAVKRVREIKKKVVTVVKKATKKIAKKVKTAVKKVKQAAKNAKKAVKNVAKSTKKWAKANASKIATVVSIVASVAVFAGCAAALGVATGGIGAIAGAAACGAVAGAVGGMIEQGGKCIEGQKGACSTGSFIKSGVLGGVTGAVGGAIGGGMGGLLAKSALKNSLPKLVGNVLDGAVTGAVSGAAENTVTYGMTCGSSKAGCSWSGAGQSAKDGAVTGALFGGGGAYLGNKFSKSKPGKQSEADDGMGASCPIKHSFTGSTKVLMADGSTKKISDIKVGDKIKNAVPAIEGKTQNHKVSRLIVTPDDRDFIDLRISSAKSPRGPPALLTTTAHHPFFSFTQQSWVDAADLRPGDQLQQIDGTRALVETTRSYQATGVTTYDLTINTLHTYYVLADTTPILVHNCGDDPQSAPGGKRGPAVSIKKLKMALGRAGMGVSDYDIVHVSEISIGGTPAYGVSPHTGSGMPQLGPRGRPLINISDMGLSDMQTAVTTVFHEIRHHQTFRLRGPDSVGGTEAAAEDYGVMMWQQFTRRVK
ncbi:RHS repeat-associated protein [Actinocorallia herbida]|uniref:RHS repeat-associated protein n=1 Tax=Actinocorallia herbida TaxID=58109 RepID=A0A3N1D401_9ACTN|nr:LamG-like jellyroll fold domain-containing protein [Actinocorallia herbida]ROO88264.1 RHS repeat-associated protein [Actinocorallia herbida]